MKKLIAIGIGISLLACAISHAKELKRVDETRAKTLFTTHLEKLGKSTGDYDISFRAFGKSTWVIHAHRKHFSYPVPWRHAMNSRGEIRELSLETLNEIFLNEYPSSPKDDDREKLIKDFVRLHSGERISIIKGTSDIPAYRKAPLDPDIAKAVRAPFSFGNLVTVVYTYQQIGGIVRRYRFEFENGTTFKRVQCAVVGREIGDAQYYE